MVFTTFWGKGADGQPLYSDWTVSFEKSGARPIKDLQDGDSVSTQSLSEEESIASNKSSSEDQAQDETKKSKEFSIHRNMVGPKSKFFTKTFTGEVHSTVITLPSNLPAHSFASIVEAFEVLLDYCYIADIREDRLSKESAVALFCLCNYLEMDDDACQKVTDFITSDLSHETVAQYYQIVQDLRCQEASSGAEFSLVLNAEPIMKMIVAMCHQSPGTLDSQSDLFKIADLTLFLSIGALLAQDEEISTESSRLWSENLTAFFDAYQEEDVLDLKESFRSLTSENILPEISPKVALRLLEHEHKNGESDLDSLVEEEEEPLVGAESITSLQQRCIKALCESNWKGKENDIEEKRGKLVNITTASVLEALLIDSVTGARALTAQMNEMATERKVEKKLLRNEIETYEFKREESKVVVAKERQKQQKLEYELNKLRKEHDKLQASYKRSQEKSVSVHTELCKANALLEAELEKEKKKTRSLDQRYRSVERSQNKTETDREMFELTVKDTIKRLDAMTGGDEAGFLEFLVSAFSDRTECKQIKAMLEQVLKDPLIYERNYLIKDVEEEREQEEADAIIQIGGDASFVYE